MSAAAGSSTDPSILRMSAPLVVSFVMRAAFSLVDTIYAATIGDPAVAAIGLTIPFEFFMIAVWVGLSTGLTSCLSRAMGAHEGNKIRQYLRATWVMVWVASPAFVLLGPVIWLWAPHMGLESEVSRAFQIYGMVLIAGSGVTSFWSVIPDSLVKAHQDTRSTMWAGIWSNVINVTLNTIFVFVFGWGVFGIALSTVIGRIGGLWYALVRARRHEQRRESEGRDTATGTDPRPYRSLLALAVPSSLTFMLMAAETALINYLLSRVAHATEAIAAYSIYYRVVLFAFNPVIAVAVALLPYSARRFGRGDVAGVRRGLRETSTALAGYCVALVGPLALWGAPWLSGFLTESAISEQYTTFALRLVPLGCLVGIPFLLCRPVFEAMQRGNPGLVMATARYGVLTVPAVLAGAAIARATGHPEFYGLLLGLLVTGAVTSIAFWLWLRGSLAVRPAVLPDTVSET
jgi:Na+-driven multidrug efflux pump